MPDWETRTIEQGCNEPLEPSEVRLYFCDVNRLGDEEHELLFSWLDAPERERHARFLFAKDRRLFSAAHGLTRAALSLWSKANGVEIAPQAWGFVADKLGKPIALFPESHGGDSPAPIFSLSHTRGAAAIAISASGMLGLDIENPERLLEVIPLIERFFAPEECADIVAQNGDEAISNRFFLYWTLKEAYLKALGLGLTKKLASFAFSTNNAEASLLYDHDGGDIQQWSFPFYRLPNGMTASLAIHNGIPHFRPRIRLYSFCPRSGWTALADT